ncbi:hypothetical protein [Thermoflavifilum thermophilum]|uniref:Uncharacterized protein n=1 Tax=Thermoflavifilum thermophilum TaxID=1393122 RepID=A0A1I7NI19_9BACT|nr:hypothetical protein [Thermoflavifilum thermophilum]SFV34311.1 hypothetical protein SAMN05660895_1963 [Thermoflavifilum thermophilum]
MKKALLTILFGIASLVIFGQARIGYTATQIKNEFWESEYNLHSGYDEDGNYYISITTERADVFYLFNSDKVCYSTGIFPHTQGDLNFYVELFNKMYVIVSPTKWKWYSNKGIVNINLIYPEDGGNCFFLFSIESLER